MDSMLMKCESVDRWIAAWFSPHCGITVHHIPVEETSIVLEKSNSRWRSFRYGLRHSRIWHYFSWLKSIRSEEHLHSKEEKKSGSAFTSFLPDIRVDNSKMLFPFYFLFRQYPFHLQRKNSGALAAEMWTIRLWMDSSRTSKRREEKKNGYRMSNGKWEAMQKKILEYISHCVSATIEFVCVYMTFLLSDEWKSAAIVDQMPSMKWKKNGLDCASACAYVLLHTTQHTHFNDDGGCSSSQMKHSFRFDTMEWRASPAHTHA